MKCNCCGEYEKPHHATAYSENSGILAMCEDCWLSRTPEERLPFYKQLWIKWAEHKCDVPWEVIRAACLHEQDSVVVETEWESNQMLTSGEYRKAISISEAWEPPFKMMPVLPKEVLTAWQNWDHVDV